jgi:hypothetical protein
MESLDGFVIALCTMKRCMLQLVPMIRQRIKFDDLRMSNISTIVRVMTNITPTISASERASA